MECQNHDLNPSLTITPQLFPCSLVLFKRGQGSGFQSFQVFIFIFLAYMQDYFIFYCEPCFPAIKGLIKGCFLANSLSSWITNIALPSVTVHNLFMGCCFLISIASKLCILNDSFKACWKVLKDRWGEVFYRMLWIGNTWLVYLRVILILLVQEKEYSKKVKDKLKE